ncbi:3-hydroxybutyryl-CoA dehydrogenase [Nocardioides sp. KC13]|uniref:3-hydroxybutyryl-CoA dehydrogenase n=1 Tax=Nocardioides turkmenicus TaxID=2711220 RepID=A0A6M1R8Y3_9ACTN|nr:3-hydroxybutyryl-CoA dehydrogenase [Nocardioides sp. KC13]
MSSIDRVGVLGCGLMGAGIAEVCARAGRDVVVVETNRPAADAGRLRVVRSLGRAVDAGKLSDDDRAAAIERLTFTADRDAFHDRQLVVEAVPEVLALKIEAFEAIDKIVTGADAILASNTSSIPIMRLAWATSRAEQVLGLHFFNPVPVLRLVEVVRSLLTGEPAALRIEEFARNVLGKEVVRSQDRAGFVVNALLIPYLLSAIRMLESGFASAADIDNGMVEGCAHPLGPLRLTDLIGLDTTVRVAESLHEEFKEPLYAPPPLLLRMVEAGLLGRKAGRRFYEYVR